MFECLIIICGNFLLSLADFTKIKPNKIRFCISWNLSCTTLLLEWRLAVNSQLLIQEMSFARRWQGIPSLEP